MKIKKGFQKPAKEWVLVKHRSLNPTQWKAPELILKAKHAALPRPQEQKKIKQSMFYREKASSQVH